jgi:hypothetical protein
MALEARSRVTANGVRRMLPARSMLPPSHALRDASKVNDVTDRPRPGLFDPSSPTVARENRIYLARGRFSRAYGQRYNAHLGSADGECIVRDALDVEYAACRILCARGIAGPLTIWHAAAAHPAMRIRSIAAAARLTLREDSVRGPCLRLYRRRLP